MGIGNFDYSLKILPKENLPPGSKIVGEEFFVNNKGEPVFCFALVPNNSNKNQKSSIPKTENSNNNQKNQKPLGLQKKIENFFNKIFPKTVDATS